jgi:hypothetical protein
MWGGVPLNFFAEKLDAYSVREVNAGSLRDEDLNRN